MEHISRNAMKIRVMETGQKMIVTTAVLWMMYAGNWRSMKILALWNKSGMRWRSRKKNTLLLRLVHSEAKSTNAVNVGIPWNIWMNTASGAGRNLIGVRNNDRQQ